ncbi:MAG TPA: FAD:protein FMN transferase [Acidimicrobiales bacterium]|nr:FAD:protein FMN transferase [Acidimicrobiales bacterium]
MHEAGFSARGSYAHIMVVGAPRPLLAAAIERVEDLEAKWSRFRPSSEVSRLNELGSLDVSDDTTLLVRRAIEGWRLSGGWFDPTVLGDVLRAGYTRTFAEVAGSGDSGLARGCGGIIVAGHHVALPAGVGFDPGGIGKGLAADIVLAELVGAGATGACVNLGGDVTVSGVAPDGTDWTIDVVHEWRPEPVCRVGLRTGAVATSTTLRRRWHTAAGDAHHLIDPHTGVPSASVVNTASVVAGHAWMAEVLAKALLLRGDGFSAVAGLGVEALTVDDSGRVATTAKFRRFTSRQPISA